MLRPDHRLRHGVPGQQHSLLLPQGQFVPTVGHLKPICRLGVMFLSTALMRFLLDFDESVKHLLPWKAYPFAAMFSVVGYLLTMLADVVVHRVYNRRTFQQLRKEDLDSATEGPETKATILRTMYLFDKLLLILTLCFHWVFDGLAISVSATTKETWREMWMVGIHKFVLALALGVVVLRLASPRPLLNMLLYGFAFAISTSLGVAISILINNTTDNSNTGDWIFAVCMGIGAGVFIYVVINHLLAWDNHKLMHKEQALSQWLGIGIGVFNYLVINHLLAWDNHKKLKESKEHKEQSLSRRVAFPHDWVACSL